MGCTILAEYLRILTKGWEWGLGEGVSKLCNTLIFKKKIMNYRHKAVGRLFASFLIPAYNLSLLLHQFHQLFCLSLADMYQLLTDHRIFDFPLILVSHKLPRNNKKITVLN